MPRTRPIQSNFTKGELSELMEGRVDIEQYFSGCKTLENFIVREAGSAGRRSGTRYVATVKTPSLFTRMVGYRQSKTAAYTLEFGNGYLRFYKNNARLENPPGTPVEIASPYVAADLPLLTFTQLNDVLFITAQFYAPRRLERFSDTVWQLRLEPFTVPPSYEYGTRPTATLTPGATSGSGVTFTASATQFEASDVGRELVVIAGTNIGARATITGFSSTTVVTGTITQNFVNTTANAATDWKITESYKTAVTPSAKSPEGATITLTLAAAGWRTGDVGKFVQLNGGVAEITGITSNLIVNAVLRSELSVVTAASSNAWSLEEAAWSSFNGYPSCNEFHEARHYYAGSLAQPQTFWGSKTDDFVNYAVGVLDDDAVQYTIADNQFNPIVWMRSSDDMLMGTSSGEFRAFGGQEKPITPTNISVKPQSSYGSSEDVAPLRIGSVVLFATASGRRLREMVFSFEINRYVSPDLLLLGEHLTRDFAIDEMAYQREPTAVVWAVRDDGTLLGMTYLRDQNVVAWHRHLTGNVLIEPMNGHQTPLDGFVESVAVIPHPDGDRDQVWLVVNRTVAGLTTRYVEYLDDARFVYRQLHTDCAKTYDGTGTTTLTVSSLTGVGVTASAGAAFFVAADVGRELRIINSAARATITGFTSDTQVIVTVLNAFPSLGAFASGSWGVARADLDGLGHLEGKTVQIIADGAPLPTQIVSVAAVTATVKGIKMEVGLPYDSVLTTVRPEIQVGGTSQGVQKHHSEVTVRLFESIGFEINNTDQMVFRTTGVDQMDTPTDLFTGDKTATGLDGWDKDGRITIAQRQPLPLTVSMITTVLGQGQ